MAIDNSAVGSNIFILTAFKNLRGYQIVSLPVFGPS